MLTKKYYLVLLVFYNIVKNLHVYLSSKCKQHNELLSHDKFLEPYLKNNVYRHHHQFYSCSFLLHASLSTHINQFTVQRSLTKQFNEALKVFNIQSAITPSCLRKFAFHRKPNYSNLVYIPLDSSRPNFGPPIRFALWNAHSVKTKTSSLCDLVLSHRLDVLSITET